MEQLFQDRLFVVAGRRRAIKHKIALLDKARVNPEYIDSNVIALFNYASLIAEAEGVENYLVLDVGTRTADLIFGDNARFHRLGTPTDF